MIIFSGPFKEDINKYIDYRVNIKHQKLNTVISCLKQFDIYTIEMKTDNVLTRELVEKWLMIKENEDTKSFNKRLYTMRVFAKYLNMIGKKSFVINTKYYLKETKFVPHIYTDKEIGMFFNTIDICINDSSKFFPNQIILIKLIFKLLYCCGLRISECLNLEFDDINLVDRSIRIKNAKFNKSRLIFIDEELTNDLNYYITNYSNNKNHYMFYNNLTNNKVSYSFIITTFHKIISNSGLNKDKRYRIHDFRHTFAVNNIRNAFNNNEDIDVLLPILMNYMGHSDIKETEYYLRLTPDVYENMVKKYEKKFNNIFMDGDNQYE